MRAAVLYEAGQPLVVEDVALRAPGPGDVVVRLAASGVCHSDLSVQNGTLPHPLPAILGHEGAGVVEEVGADVTDLAPGDHVILSWVAPCRRCVMCLAGQPQLCEHGMDHAWAAPHATSGSDAALFAGLAIATFAEHTVVPAAAAIRIDPTLPFDVASLMGCGVVTGVGAVVNAARVPPGASVAVVGCGGVGLAAVQGARLCGAARIVAVDTNPSKLALAMENGATDVVDAGAGGGGDPVAAVRELTGGRGVDHAFEVVGLSATIRQAYAMARRGGTVTVVGAGSFDDQVSFSAMELMADGKTVIGCVYGSTDPARDFPRLVELHQTGRLDITRLISRRVTLDETNDALAAMTAGEVARSVIVF